MRALVLLVVPVLLACHSEPDFDERYDAAQRQIRDTAEDIDAQLTASASPYEDRSSPAGPVDGGEGGAGSSAPVGP